jgi:hypothetical protein
VIPDVAFPNATKARSTSKQSGDINPTELLKRLKRLTPRAHAPSDGHLSLLRLLSEVVE